MIEIYHSKEEDLARIMPIYESAKRFMRQSGNLTQWTGGYPSEDVIRCDIENGNHFIGITENGVIAVVFTFIIGMDATYSLIENGEWLNSKPYGTIHRIASSGIKSNTLKRVTDFCFQKIKNIRIDTHADNTPMLSALSRLRFTQCGIIYTDDGSPRVAFQKEIVG